MENNPINTEHSVHASKHSVPYGREYFMEKINEKKIKKQEKKEKRRFCWNSIKTFWTYIGNRNLRKYLMGDGVVMEVTLLEPGSGYIKNREVCTFDQIHDECSRQDTLKVNLELEDGKIISAKPSDKFRGYFYKPGDVLLVKGGDNNGFIKITKTWPTESEFLK